MASGIYNRVKGTQLRDPFDKLKSDISAARTKLEKYKDDLIAKISNTDEEINRLTAQLEKLNKVME